MYFVWKLLPSRPAQVRTLCIFYKANPPSRVLFFLLNYDRKDLNIRLKRVIKHHRRQTQFPHGSGDPLCQFVRALQDNLGINLCSPAHLSILFMQRKSIYNVNMNKSIFMSVSNIGII